MTNNKGIEERIKEFEDLIENTGYSKYVSTNQQKEIKSFLSQALLLTHDRGFEEGKAYGYRDGIKKMHENTNAWKDLAIEQFKKKKG